MTNITEVINSLTAKGRETMTAIGKGELTFFDEGIVEHSGSWGSALTEEMGHKSSGVLNRLRDMGLLYNTPDDSDIDAGDWWALTALGAEVAQHLGHEETDEVAEAVVDVKRGPKWTYIFVNGEQVMEVRSHLADAVLATVKFV